MRSVTLAAVTVASVTLIGCNHIIVYAYRYPVTNCDYLRQPLPENVHASYGNLEQGQRRIVCDEAKNYELNSRELEDPREPFRFSYPLIIAAKRKSCQLSVGLLVVDSSSEVNSSRLKEFATVADLVSATLTKKYVLKIPTSAASEKIIRWNSSKLADFCEEFNGQKSQ